MRHILLSLVIGSGFAATAHAIPMTSSYNVDFSSPTQSFWGPGQGAADFGINQMILGNTTFGMRFQAGASSGTVKSNYNGAISVGYDNLVEQGPVNLSLGFMGDSNGGHFDTNLGAFVKVTAYFPGLGGVTVTNPTYSLVTNRTYTPSPYNSVTDSDSFTPASTAIGPNIGVGSAQAGIDYDIVQNARHTVSALNGVVRATRLGGGETRMSSFSLDATDTISLNLDLPGVWDIQLMNLSLDNLFSTDFDLSFDPFMQYTLGVNCGDAGMDGDNGFGCISDGRLDTNLASVNLFSNTPFALAMQSSNTLSSFQINVATPVPEPHDYALFLAGLGLTGWVANRRRKV